VPSGKGAGGSGGSTGRASDESCWSGGGGREAAAVAGGEEASTSTWHKVQQQQQEEEQEQQEEYEKEEEAWSIVDHHHKHRSGSARPSETGGGATNGSRPLSAASQRSVGESAPARSSYLTAHVAVFDMTATHPAAPIRELSLRVCPSLGTAAARLQDGLVAAGVAEAIELGSGGGAVVAWRVRAPGGGPSGLRLLRKDDVLPAGATVDVEVYKQ